MSEFFPSRSSSPEPEPEPVPDTDPDQFELPDPLLKIIEGKDHATRLALANDYLCQLRFELIFKNTCSIGGSGAICPLSKEQQDLLKKVDTYVATLKNDI
jgi:hypothetical protein